MKLHSVFTLLGIYLFSFGLCAQSIKFEAESYSSMFGVTHQATSDLGGGEDVGVTKSEDWLSYMVDIPKSGYYKVEYRISGLAAIGELALQKYNMEVATSVFGPNESWQTISLFVHFHRGPQALRLFIKAGGFKINWWQLTLVNDKKDHELPTMPSNLQLCSSDIGFSLSWDVSADNVGVVGYNIYVGDKKIGSSTTNSFHIDRLKSDFSYLLSVEAYDTKGNVSPKSLIEAKTNVSSTLIWGDEFDYKGLVDSTKWSYDSPLAGDGNQELQYYRPRNEKYAHVANGSLIIEAFKDSFGGKQYTSARLISDKKGTWLYGKVEISAKIPTCRGSWPAIWMMPSDGAYGGWPSSGEIDIMEHVGWDKGNVHTSLHFQDRNGMNKQHPTSKRRVANVESDFHLYSLLWFPDRIEWYFDNQWVYTYSNPNTGWESWPYNKPFYLILNVAVGGVWGGQEGIDETAFPQKMEIDYVRVYDMHPGVDQEKPMPPANFKAKAMATSATLSWNGSQDNLGVDSYAIYDKGELISTVKTLNTLIRRLVPETPYTFSIIAKDYAGNLSEPTSVSFVTPSFSGLAIPATIEAEAFNAMDGVQIENCSDLGLGKNLGWIDPADWMEYYINATESGSYRIDLRAATLNVFGMAQIVDENSVVLATVSIPSTGGWQSWQTVSSSEFQLSKGNHALRIQCLNAGFNLNWFSIDRSVLQSVSTLADSKSAK